MQKQAIKTEVNPVQSDEIWRDVVGYEGRYIVNEKGDIVRMYKNAGVLSPQPMPKDCKKYGLSEHEMCKTVTMFKANGKRKIEYVSEIVAAAFLGEKPVNCYLNFKDGDYSNNSLENLEYLLNAPQGFYYNLI